LRSAEWKGKDITVNYNEDNSLISVQVPKAAPLVEEILETSLKDMEFMTSRIMKYKKHHADIRVSRCGYTGEDGFEISVPAHVVVPFVEALIKPKDE